MRWLFVALAGAFALAMFPMLLTRYEPLTAGVVWLLATALGVAVAREIRLRRCMGSQE